MFTLMDKQIITFICTKSFLWTFELIFLPGNHHHSALILILEYGIQRSNRYREEEESGVVVKVTMRVHRVSSAKIICVKLRLFSYRSVETCVLGAQKNRLIETVLLSTHNICFG